MPFDRLLREMIRHELERVIAPLASAVEQLQQSGDLATQLSSLLGNGVKRGPGRHRKVQVAVAAAGFGKRGRKGRILAHKPWELSRACAVIGCKRQSLSKGYCSSHYQKRRMLRATDRLPAEWVENAQPNSVKDVVLPRGRLGAKALAEAK